MKTHTPGPWKILPEEVGRDYIRVRGTVYGTRFKIANVLHPGSTHPDDDSQTRANARLIAASPELLQELEKAHRIISNALNLMTSEQKRNWANANARDGVDGEGITRATEREAVIAKTKGVDA